MWNDAVDVEKDVISEVSARLNSNWTFDHKPHDLLQIMCSCSGVVDVQEGTFSLNVLKVLKNRKSEHLEFNNLTSPSAEEDHVIRSKAQEQLLNSSR